MTEAEKLALLERRGFVRRRPDSRLWERQEGDLLRVYTMEWAIEIARVEESHNSD